MTTTLDGVYKAVCLDVTGTTIRAKVPQIFADEVVTCLASAGNLPTAGQEGWMAFESGYPDKPVWMGVNLDPLTPGSNGGGGGGTADERGYHRFSSDPPTDLINGQLWIDADAPPPPKITVSHTAPPSPAVDDVWIVKP